MNWKEFWRKSGLIVMLVVMSGLMVFVLQFKIKQLTATGEIRESFSYMEGRLKGRGEVRRQAIHFGAGEYYIADKLTGTVDFRWITTNGVFPEVGYDGSEW